MSVGETARSRRVGGPGEEKSGVGDGAGCLSVGCTARKRGGVEWIRFINAQMQDRMGAESSGVSTLSEAMELLRDDAKSRQSC